MEFSGIVGKVLREARDVAGLTLEDVAEGVRFSKQALSLAENAQEGSVRPSDGILNAYYAKLGKRIDPAFQANEILHRFSAPKTGGTPGVAIEETPKGPLWGGRAVLAECTRQLRVLAQINPEHMRREVITGLPANGALFQTIRSQREEWRDATAELVSAGGNIRALLDRRAGFMERDSSVLWAVDLWMLPGSYTPMRPLAPAPRNAPMLDPLLASPMGGVIGLIPPKATSLADAHALVVSVPEEAEVTFRHLEQFVESDHVAVATTASGRDWRHMRAVAADPDQTPGERLVVKTGWPVSLIPAPVDEQRADRVDGSRKDDVRDLVKSRAQRFAGMHRRMERANVRMILRRQSIEKLLFKRDAPYNDYMGRELGVGFTAAESIETVRYLGTLLRSFDRFELAIVDDQDLDARTPEHRNALNVNWDVTGEDAFQLEAGDYSASARNGMIITDSGSVRSGAYLFRQIWDALPPGCTTREQSIAVIDSLVGEAEARLG